MTNPPDSKHPDHLETLSRGLSLLRQFGAGQVEMTIQDAADRMGLSRAAARRFLLTLTDTGYLERVGRTFRMTPKVLDFGFNYFSSLDLPAIANPVLKALSDRSGETCGLYILHGHDVIVIGASGNRRSLTFAPNRGTTFPAYATAVGRVLLSASPDDRLADYLATVSIEALTPFTVSNAKALKAEILRARNQGFSAVFNELAYGMSGVAAPIINSEGAYAAAINISMQRGDDPTAMLDSCLPALLGAAAEISAILQRLGR